MTGTGRAVERERGGTNNSNYGCQGPVGLHSMSLDQGGDAEGDSGGGVPIMKKMMPMVTATMARRCTNSLISYARDKGQTRAKRQGKWASRRARRTLCRVVSSLEVAL